MDNFEMDDNVEPIPDMDVHYSSLVEFLQNSSEMKKTAVHGIKQGMFAGAGAVTGGLLAGPIGGLIGGICGSIYGYWQTPNYEGMVQHITQLPKSNQEVLLNQVRACLISAGANNSRDLLLANPRNFQSALVTFAAQPNVRNEIWKYCVEALQQTETTETATG